MEEKDATPKEKPEEVKSQWQLQKENWYDRVPLTVKQLDKIIATCLVLYLDAKDIFHIFVR